MKKEATFYRPELDVLRFIAFLFVFTHHEQGGVGVVGGIGATGLPIFFLLSSFLITELLLREHEQTGRIHLSAFYVRRVFRIWPLYFAFIIAAELINCFSHSLIPAFARHSFPLVAFGYFSLLGGNWYVFLHGWPLTMAVPLWSISIEEQFYLLWPSVARNGRRGIWLFSGAAYVASIVALFYLCHPARGRFQVWTDSFVQFRYFALGAVLALLLRKRPVMLSWWMRLALLGSALSLFAVSVNYLHLLYDWQRFATQDAAYLCLDLGVLALFLSLYGWEVPSYLQPLVYLGKLSYGLYVFHVMVLFLLETYHPRSLYLPALAVTFCCAVVSYYCIERPFLELKRRFTYVRTRDD